MLRIALKLIDGLCECRTSCQQPSGISAYCMLLGLYGIYMQHMTKAIVFLLVPLLHVEQDPVVSK